VNNLLFCAHIHAKKSDGLKTQICLASLRVKQNEAISTSKSIIADKLSHDWNKNKLSHDWNKNKFPHSENKYPPITSTQWNGTHRILINQRYVQLWCRLPQLSCPLEGKGSAKINIHPSTQWNGTQKWFDRYYFLLIKQIRSLFLFVYLSKQDTHNYDDCPNSLAR